MLRVPTGDHFLHQMRSLLASAAVYSVTLKASSTHVAFEQQFSKVIGIDISTHSGKFGFAFSQQRLPSEALVSLPSEYGSQVPRTAFAIQLSLGFNN